MEEIAIRKPASMLASARVSAGVFFLAAALSGCATLLAPQTVQLRDALPRDLPERVELAGVPFFPQDDYQCGPAALATSLASYGVRVAPEDLVGQVYIPRRQGSLQVEMLAAARRYDMVSYQIAPRIEDALREVAAGNPVVVLQNLGMGPFDKWHYAVVAGYDFKEGEVVLRSGERQRLVIPIALLEYTWKKSGYWAMVTLPPDRIPATAGEESYLAAIAAMERVADPRAAKIAYMNFLRRWPENVAASLGLANAHYALKELADTERVLRRAAERNPQSVAVLNNLAQALADQGRAEEALATIERALALGGPYAETVRETREQIRQRMKAGN